MSMEDQMNFMQMTAQRVKESEAQLPAVLRQVLVNAIVCHACVCARACTCLCVRVCVCMCACAYTCAYALVCMHACVCVRVPLCS
jgi:hypothetical protein